MDVIKIQFKKQVKGVDAGEVELTWISPLKTKQYFIMDDYKYVIVVENVEVVVINVKKLIIKGLAIQKQEKMELTITSAHKKKCKFTCYLHKDTIINVIDCQEHHELCKKTNPINIIWLYTVELMKLKLYKFYQ